ncbi:hypothetical protein KGM48_01440 [Patescibacteria group bacterium]|nr:hypothetical protein [Patescibacteria group bacterium]
MAPREIDLILTDFGFHATPKRNAKTLEGSIAGKTPDGQPHGRFYGSINAEGKLEIPFPQEMIDQLQRGELKIRLLIPKEGLYGFAGKDIPEKLAQIQKKKRNMGKHAARLHKKKHSGV